MRVHRSLPGTTSLLVAEVFTRDVFALLHAADAAVVGAGDDAYLDVATELSVAATAQRVAILGLTDAMIPSGARRGGAWVAEQVAVETTCFRVAETGREFSAVAGPLSDRLGKRWVELDAAVVVQIEERIGAADTIGRAQLGAERRFGRVSRCRDEARIFARAIAEQRKIACIGGVSPARARRGEGEQGEGEDRGSLVHAVESVGIWRGCGDSDSKAKSARFPHVRRSRRQGEPGARSLRARRAVLRQPRTGAARCA